MRFVHVLPPPPSGLLLYFSVAVLAIAVDRRSVGGLMFVVVAASQPGEAMWTLFSG